MELNSNSISLSIILLIGGINCMICCCRCMSTVMMTFIPKGGHDLYVVNQTATTLLPTDLVVSR